MAARPDLALDLVAQQDFLRRLALDLVGRAEDADELVQEANLQALERPPEDALRLRGWLATVLGRLAARSRWRAAQRCEREREAARPEALESGLEEFENARCLFDGLAKLPEPYRQALVLRYWRDQSPERIARTLDVPVETVRSRLARGRRQLREELERRGFGGRRGLAATLVALAWPSQGWLAIALEPLTGWMRRWRLELATGALLMAFALSGPAPRPTSWVSLGPSLSLATPTTLPMVPFTGPARPLQPAQPLQLEPAPPLAGSARPHSGAVAQLQR